jgi:hypothetical protein
LFKKIIKKIKKCTDKCSRKVILKGVKRWLESVHTAILRCSKNMTTLTG